MLFFNDLKRFDFFFNNVYAFKIMIVRLIKESTGIILLYLLTPQRRPNLALLT